MPLEQSLIVAEIVDEVLRQLGVVYSKQNYDVLQIKSCNMII